MKWAVSASSCTRWPGAGAQSSSIQGYGAIEEDKCETDEETEECTIAHKTGATSHSHIMLTTDQVHAQGLRWDDWVDMV